MKTDNTAFIQERFIILKILLHKLVRMVGVDKNKIIGPQGLDYIQDALGRGIPTDEGEILMRQIALQRKPVDLGRENIESDDFFKVKKFVNSINISSPFSDLRIQIQTDLRYQDLIQRAILKDVLC